MNPLNYLKQTRVYTAVKQFMQKYERFLMPAFLVFGFVMDVVTFKAIDVNTAFIILTVHAILVGLGITFLRVRAERWQDKTGKLIGYGDMAAPAIMQFSLGALLSMVLIFYTFSGAVGVSWPFLGTILFLAVSNEIFKQYYLKPTIQFVAYFFVLFALISIILPFVFHSISPFLFFLSAALGLGAIYGFMSGLGKFLPHVKAMQRRVMKFAGGIAAAVLVLYMFNLIPPVPMSLREAGLYHQVIRAGNQYHVVKEDQSIFRALIPGQTVHVGPGQRVYVFSAIFAPSGLSTSIVHHWQWKNPETGDWQSMGRPSYPLSGGRKDGFRGYSFRSSNIPAGKWRVDLETPRGQVMGRTSFRVKSVEEPFKSEVIVK